MQGVSQNCKAKPTLLFEEKCPEAVFATIFVFKQGMPRIKKQTKGKVRSFEGGVKVRLYVNP